MISVLEESQTVLPGECRFYYSDLHKSEVTSTHTLCWASCVCFLGVYRNHFGLVEKQACISALSLYFWSFWIFRNGLKCVIIFFSFCDSNC